MERNPCTIDYAVVDKRMSAKQREEVLRVGNYYNCSSYYYENSAAYLYDEFRDPLCFVDWNGSTHFIDSPSILG
jgi:hypothetical protein